MTPVVLYSPVLECGHSEILCQWLFVGVCRDVVCNTLSVQEAAHWSRCAGLDVECIPVVVSVSGVCYCSPAVVLESSQWLFVCVCRDVVCNTLSVQEPAHWSRWVGLDVECIPVVVSVSSVCYCSPAVVLESS